MAKRYKVDNFQGYQKIVTPENSDLEEINLAFIKNNENNVFKGNTNGEESVFVITEGRVKFSLESKLMGEMERENVFDEPPCAVYLPPYSNYSIEFEEKSELCIVSCKAKGMGKPKFIGAKDVRFKRVGLDTYMRNTHEILPEDFPAEKLILGETITDPGNWAGYPPEETTFEELNFFKITPRTGFGTVRVFNESEDNMFLVKNDEVLTIPKGYHPISVAPKHRIYYLWALAGKTRKVVPIVHPDYRFNGKV